MKELLVVILVCLVVAAIMWMNKRLRENIQNIFKIEELRKRILYTLINLGKLSVQIGLESLLLFRCVIC